MTKIDKVLFTGKTHTTASRGGSASLAVRHYSSLMNLTQEPASATEPR